jgi:hypothetical protein
MWLVREARKHILAGDFRTWKEMMLKIWPKIVKKCLKFFSLKYKTSVMIL